MPEAHDCEVLIVGAGPVGVALSLALARRGVTVIAADKAPEIYPLPRAAHVDHETMRIFQALGVADEVMASSRPASRYATDVRVKFCVPERLVRIRASAARATVAVPKAAVDEDRQSEFRQRYIRSSGQVALMQAVAEACAV